MLVPGSAQPIMMAQRTQLKRKGSEKKAALGYLKVPSGIGFKMNAEQEGQALSMIKKFRDLFGSAISNRFKYLG